MIHANILHQGGDHLTISTVGVEHPRVRVYDSRRDEHNTYKSHTSSFAGLLEGQADESFQIRHFHAVQSVVRRRVERYFAQVDFRKREA